MDTKTTALAPQRLSGKSQSKGVRIAVIAVACVLAVTVAAIAFAVAALPYQAAVITESDIATVPATVRADHVPALSVKLDRGELVDIVGERDGYYLVEHRGEEGASADADALRLANAYAQESENAALISKQGTARLYIAKDYVRPIDQSAPAQRTGYILSPTSLFPTAMLTGAPVAELEQNTKVTVLDEFADCLFVELADKTRGYVAAQAVGDEPVEESAEGDQARDGDAGHEYYTPQHYSDGSGLRSNGRQGSDADSGGGASGADGGDIVLPDPAAASYARSSKAAPQPLPFVAQAYADEPSAMQATVLSDGVQAYLGWFDRGETIDIVDASCLRAEDASLIPEGKAVVVMGDQRGLVDANLIKLAGDADYKPWEGFTALDSGLYPTFELSGEPTILEANQKVTVIDDLSTCYVVMLGDQLGYMAKGEVSATPFEEPEEEAIDYGPDPFYGGSYDYGYDAGSLPVDAGSAGSSSEVIEEAIGGWTDEKL